MTHPDSDRDQPAAAQTLGEIAAAMREALAQQEARGYRDDSAVIDHTNAVLEARARSRQRNHTSDAPGWPADARQRANELFASGEYPSWSRAHQAAYRQVAAEHQARTEERVLASEAELDPADDSLQARLVRASAGSIRDHRASAARRDDPANEEVSSDEPPSRDAARWSPGHIRDAYRDEFRQQAHQLAGGYLAEQWYQFGLDPDDAAKWANAGFTPNEALPHIHRGQTVDEVLREETRHHGDPGPPWDEPAAPTTTTAAQTTDPFTRARELAKQGMREAEVEGEDNAGAPADRAEDIERSALEQQARHAASEAKVHDVLNRCAQRVAASPAEHDTARRRDPDSDDLCEVDDG